MEVAQAVHMKGGPGDASYGNQDVHLSQQTFRHKSYELLAYPLASTECANKRNIQLYSTRIDFVFYMYKN